MSFQVEQSYQSKIKANVQEVKFVVNLTNAVKESPKIEVKEPYGPILARSNYKVSQCMTNKKLLENFNQTCVKSNGKQNQSYDQFAARKTIPTRCNASHLDFSMLRLLNMSKRNSELLLNLTESYQNFEKTIQTVTNDGNAVNFLKLMNNRTDLIQQVTQEIVFPMLADIQASNVAELIKIIMKEISSSQKFWQDILSQAEQKRLRDIEALQSDKSGEEYIVAWRNLLLLHQRYESADDIKKNEIQFYQPFINSSKRLNFLCKNDEMKALLKLLQSGEVQLQAMKDKIVEESERIEALKEEIIRLQNYVSDSVLISSNETQQLLVKYDSAKKGMKDNAPMKKNLEKLQRIETVYAQIKSAQKTKIVSLEKQLQTTQETLFQLQANMIQKQTQSLEEIQTQKGNKQCIDRSVQVNMFAALTSNATNEKTQEIVMTVESVNSLIALLLSSKLVYDYDQ